MNVFVISVSGPARGTLGCRADTARQARSSKFSAVPGLELRHGGTARLINRACRAVPKRAWAV